MSLKKPPDSARQSISFRASDLNNNVPNVSASSTRTARSRTLATTPTSSSNKAPLQGPLPGGISLRTTTPPVASESLSAAARRNRLTLLASRRRPVAPISTPRENENPIYFMYDSPNHNLDQSSSNNNRRPQRINRQRDAPPAIRRTSAGTRVSRSKNSIQGKQEKGSTSKVLEGSDKYLPKIFRHLNWSELLPMRCVCKKWLEVVSTNPLVSEGLGTIVIKNNHWEDQLQLFNESPAVWTKFKFEANIFFDLMDTIQLNFWMKHGVSMRALEIKNRSMTLTGFVEILSRCPNLSRFVVRWTPEMYSFNAELIKKYYGVNFYNGSFGNMREFSVERSCYLNDDALMSILKWCGGNLKSLSLTYRPEDEQQDPLTRLKPRWTIQPVKNYIDRFGYTGNLQYLDFSWSNLTPQDIQVLADVDNLSMLKGITLNHCNKLDDKSITNFLVKKGARLERLWIAEIPLTDAIFGANEVKQVSVPRLKSLNISGSQGNFQNLTFLVQLQVLEELYAANTSWLDYSRLMTSLKLKGKHNNLQTVDISGDITMDGAKHIDINMNRVWFKDLTVAFSRLVKLNLSQWTQFCKNDNFSAICQNMPLLQELRLRGWKELTDSGVTGLPVDKLHGSQSKTDSREDMERFFVGSLIRLSVLDLSDCSITDATIRHGINFLPCLRIFGFENTQISDAGILCILKENRTVEKISTAGCDHITRKKLKYLRSDSRVIQVGKISEC